MIKVRCVDGNVFINDVHLYSDQFKGFEKASALVNLLEKQCGESNVDFQFNSKGSCYETAINW